MKDLILNSSKDLKNEVMLGNFREDLYHRLNVVPIEIPGLKSRTADIPLLIKYLYPAGARNSANFLKAFPVTTCSEL